VQRGHDDFEGRALLGGVLVHGDAAPVVRHLGDIAGQQAHLNVGADAGEHLVNAVINGLGEDMVQAAHARGPDVHRGTVAHPLQALEHGDL